MVILKKLKSATLVEAIVATVLILIVFMVASAIINNLLMNRFNKSTHKIEYRLNELEYKYQNNEIKLPYQESIENWNVLIKKEKINNQEYILIEAKNENIKKQIFKRRIDVE